MLSDFVCPFLSFLKKFRKPSGDPYWFKDAVIYELHVRSFFDSKNDGIGDFPGLISKLDYLKDLGVTVLWLLPFYPSPLKDDGYDIAHYRDVNPLYGNLEEFKCFIREAHRRGLKVITELVLNHSSDQHRFFVKERQRPHADPKKNFYVWSDSKDKYQQARVIFKDFETSNWTWDPVAKRYFWHRFFSHQPDLNFESPKVQREVIKIADFWLDLGVDGLRLDALPYLFEKEGTNCENLPETHAFVKKLRCHMDWKYDDRLLLAEVNQPLQETIKYFGHGDECHMIYHFPIMPRLFSALHKEDAAPILPILRETAVIPEDCQWAVFLRNHDELTLEMVSDEEREYLYRAYAQEKMWRLNVGIRKRLAPLLGNNRKKIELMYGLLFSLSGTPIIYYGDEIGMGDNPSLPDRTGIRTPMQWDSSVNAGFSIADPSLLYAQPNTEPEYHYEHVNVAFQEKDPDSLLNWLKNLIHLRNQHKTFGRGKFVFLKQDNPKVLSYLLVYEKKTLLVVVNFSRAVEFINLDLADYAGKHPKELTGQKDFPIIEKKPYLITIAPQTFYWFELKLLHAT